MDELLERLKRAAASWRKAFREIGNILLAMQRRGDNVAVETVEN